MGYTPSKNSLPTTLATVHERMREVAEVCVRVQANWLEARSGSRINGVPAGAVAGAEVLKDLMAYHHDVAIHRIPADPDPHSVLSERRGRFDPVYAGGTPACMASSAPSHAGLDTVRDVWVAIRR